MVSSQTVFIKTYQICSFYFCWELSGYNLWVMISSFLGFPGGSEGKASPKGYIQRVLSKNRKNRFGKF